eukprot:5764015-Pleurochrysis_carterae.AAC.1
MLLGTRACACARGRNGSACAYERMSVRARVLLTLNAASYSISKHASIASPAKQRDDEVFGKVVTNNPEKSSSNRALQSQGERSRWGGFASVNMARTGVCLQVNGAHKLDLKVGVRGAPIAARASG